MATATRLYVPDDLEADTVIGASRDQAHYLRSVLRFKGGEPVVLFNGRDGEWAARVEGVGKGWASLKVEAKRRDQEAGPDLWLLFAPIKRARHDFLIQKAVELGVSRIVPVMTQRTNVDRVKQERLEANAVEAAEQCERLDIPEVSEPLRLEKVLSGWPDDRHLVLCTESGEARPMAQALAEADNSSRPRWAILVGPEGGFSNEELETLRECPFVMPVGLGPRILRAETAALAAVAVWESVMGDWGSRPPDRMENKGPT